MTVFKYIISLPKATCGRSFILKVHLHEIFFVLIFCTDQTHIGQIIRLLNVFNFFLEFADLFKFFNIRR
jgi:hypothetical protein